MRIDRSRGLAAFGQNREVFGNLEAYLIEATSAPGKHAFYTRAESVAKDILDAGFHPIGVAHTHRPSRVGALTLGYVRDVAVATGARSASAATSPATWFRTILQESYGSPWSFHVFRALSRPGRAPDTHRIDVGARVTDRLPTNVAKSVPSCRAARAAVRLRDMPRDRLPIEVADRRSRAVLSG